MRKIRVKDLERSTTQAAIISTGYNGEPFYFLPTNDGVYSVLSGNINMGMLVNGIQFISSNIGIGGSLTQSTTISGINTYSFNFNNITEFSINTDAFKVSSNNVITLASLKTSLTAPITSGTKKMVITDNLGNLSFENIPAGTPGGTNTQIQYNNNGIFGGAYDFTYNNVTGTIKIPNLMFFDTDDSRSRIITGRAITIQSNFIGTGTRVQLGIVGGNNTTFENTSEVNIGLGDYSANFHKSNLNITGRLLHSTLTKDISLVNINPNYNLNSNGTAGTVRGIYYNPWFSGFGISTTTHIAFENTSGNVRLCSTSGNVNISTTDNSEKLNLGGNIKLTASSLYYGSHSIKFEGLGYDMLPQTGTIHLETGAFNGQRIKIAAAGVTVAIGGAEGILPSNGVFSSISSSGMSLNANSTTNGFILSQGNPQTSGDLFKLRNVVGLVFQDYIRITAATGSVIVNSLKSGSTAPGTTGTTKMVVSDANGLLSFANFSLDKLSITVTIDFPNVSSNSHADETISFSGAVDGDTVLVGAKASVIPSGVSYFAFVSAPDTVVLRLMNGTTGSVNPPSGDFKLTIIR